MNKAKMEALLTISNYNIVDLIRAEWGKLVNVPIQPLKISQRAPVFEKTQIVGNIEADGVAGSGHIVLLL